MVCLNMDTKCSPVFCLYKVHTVRRMFNAGLLYYVPIQLHAKICYMLLKIVKIVKLEHVHAFHSGPALIVNGRFLLCILNYDRRP